MYVGMVEVKVFALVCCPKAGIPSLANLLEPSSFSPGFHGWCRLFPCDRRIIMPLATLGRCAWMDLAV